MYKSQERGYNGGGWISSLETLVSKQPGITLGISFFDNDENFRVARGNTTYYPISIYSRSSAKIKHNIFYSRFDEVETKTFLSIVEDFKPDLIHIFGSEQSFGLIAPFVTVPVVIHIQGILGPYLNAMFAPGTNKFDYLRHMRIAEAIKKFRELRFFSHNAIREERILANCKYFMGRTHWDKAIVQLHNPRAEYFYCSEILRQEFYQAKAWVQNYSPDDVRIVSTLSKTDYKGFDLILKAAALLKKFTNTDFTWAVYGIKDYSFWEKKLGMEASKLNIKLMGVASSDTLIKALQSADIFVHPSYIDNSPNSVCEAQYLGVPVIATNVGGVSSLVDHGRTGMLVPANDPYSLAQTILRLHHDPAYATAISAEGRITAMHRHDVNSILEQNLTIYKCILEKTYHAPLL
ncbi:MAG: hypothetical protein BGO21_30515 [Dyadobacter sp. 50-39]|nr:MAG: hypothetical protein BGO21_30515 [Dyadobacter sp. 50-39]